MKKAILFVLVWCVLGLTALPLPTDASWIETIGLGTRSTAMGSAYIGVADDLYSVWYNPAGLTGLIGGKRFDTSLGLGFSSLNATYRERTRVGGRAVEASYDDEFRNVIFIPNVAMGFDVGDWLYVCPFALLPSWMGGMQFSQTEGQARFSTYELSDIYTNWMPTVGFKIARWLSIGLGLDVNVFNQVEFHTILGDGYSGAALGAHLGMDPCSTARLTTNGVTDGSIQLRTDKEFPTGLVGVEDMDLNLENTGFRLGLMVRPHDKIRVGAVYRSEMRVETEGTIELILTDPLIQLIREQLPMFASMVADDVERFNLVKALPQQIGLGIGWDVTDRLLWAVDWVWTDWHHARVKDVINIAGDGLGPTEIKAIVIRRHWKSVHSLRTGLAYRLNDNIQIMGGFWYEPHPTPDKYWDISSGYNTRYTFTTGAKYFGFFDGMLDIGASLLCFVSSNRSIEQGESENLGGAKYYVDPVEQGFASNKDFTMVMKGFFINGMIDFTLHF